MINKSQSLRAVRMFEFYVRYIWPIHRLFVRGKIARRCVKCAASERMIQIGSNGICEDCSHNSSISRVRDPNHKDEKTLNHILQSVQGRGTYQHDALVLFSGGKDSTYMIRRLRDEFPGLRLLAYTIDNSFMSPVAKENIDEMIHALNVEHVFVRPQRSFYIKLFRYCITHLNAEGGYGTVDFSDGEFMLDTARRLAAEKKIPLILCGYSRYQVQNGLKLQSFETPREKELSDRKETAGIPLESIFTPDEIRFWWHGSQWPVEDVARILFPLYAWDLEESEIKSQVIRWGLMSEKSHSPLVTNHQLIPLIGTVDVHVLGYSSFEIEFCRMIREGKARKREWQHTFEFLEYTAKTGLFIKPTILASLSQLGLSTNDVGIHYN